MPQGRGLSLSSAFPSSDPRSPSVFFRLKCFNTLSPSLYWEKLHSLKHHCGPALELLWMSMSLLYWGDQTWVQHCSCVSPVLSWGAQSPPFTCWWCSSSCFVPLRIRASLPRYFSIHLCTVAHTSSGCYEQPHWNQGKHLSFAHISPCWQMDTSPSVLYKGSIGTT